MPTNQTKCLIPIIYIQRFHYSILEAEAINQYKVVSGGAPPLSNKYKSLNVVTS